MPFNVLIVDDSSVMRKMLIRALKLSGLPVAEIYEAANGREGLLLLAKFAIDLAVVDVNMPVMNGMELIDRIRQDSRTSKLPILVVSTESSESRIEALKEHKVGFVHKPFTPEKIRNVLARTAGVSNDEICPGHPFQSGGVDF